MLIPQPELRSDLTIAIESEIFVSVSFLPHSIRRFIAIYRKAIFCRTVSGFLGATRSEIPGRPESIECASAGKVGESQGRIAKTQIFRRCSEAYSDWHFSGAPSGLGLET
jgi:hypothetical protein